METNQVVTVTPTMLSTWHYGNLTSVAVSANNQAIIGVGDNVHSVNFVFASVVPAPLTRAQLITDVASVKLLLNGEVIFDRTPTQILDDYKMNFDHFGALAAPLGVLVCNCMRNDLDNWDQYRGAALGMLKSNGKPGQGPYNTLSYEVIMTAAAATAATCEVQVVTDLYPQEHTGMHMRRLRTSRNLAAIGDNFIVDLPRHARGLSALHVVTAVMNRVSVTADTREIYHDLDWNSLQIMMDQAHLTPQAGYTTIPFNLGRDLWGFLPYGGLSKFIINFHTTAAPGAGTVILLDEIWDHVKE
jgi:hypothetical protein